MFQYFSRLCWEEFVLIGYNKKTFVLVRGRRNCFVLVCLKKMKGCIVLIGEEESALLGEEERA